MPQIQIIGQEKLAARMGERDRQVQREQMQQTAMQKSMEFKQMAEELKIRAKATEVESERNRILSLGQRMDYLSKTYDTAAKYENPELVIGQMLKISGDETMRAMTDPMVSDMTGKLSPVGGAYKKTLSDVIRKKYNLDQPRQQFGGVGEGLISDPNRTNIPNQPQANIVGGGMPGGNEPILTDLNESGATVNFPDELYNKSYYSGLGSEAAKPYGLEENKIISATGTINNAVGNINKLLDKGALGGPGSQIMTDMGNPMLASGMPLKTREALQSMNQLKNLIPFARGGKQLTPYESKLVFRLLNTTGKTPDMIRRDLAVYQREFNTMVKVMSTARGQLNLADLTQNFGGGRTYEELVGEGGSRGNLSGSGDPLGLFGGL